MDKSNLELFKQAISEGLSEKFDSVVNDCTDEIVCSEKHNVAMRTIIYGKANTKKTLSPKMRRIIAILVAAALLLTSCGIVFRNEIREVFEEFFASITFSEHESNADIIEEVYELGYLPEGYYLEEETVSDLSAVYKFVDKNNNFIKFEQSIISGSDYVIDSESGYSKMLEIEEYDVYYRYTDTYNCYIWSDGKYSIKLKSTIQFSNEELTLILNGIAIK